jgi:hypothetical protein
VWFAAPVRVLEDGPDGVVTWLAPGTSCRAADIGGQRANVVATLAAGGWSFRGHVWFGWRQLLIWPAGSSHTLWPVHDETSGALTTWYLNLQAPVRRGPAHLDTLDLFLDMLVDPDLSAWRWKDEGELEEARAAGLVDDDTIARLRQEGEALVARLPAIIERWRDWTPDPTWQPLPLPVDWAETGE